MASRPTIADVAKQAGLSVATVDIDIIDVCGVDVFDAAVDATILELHYSSGRKSQKSNS